MLHGPIEIQQSIGKLVITQGPSQVMKLVTYGWPLLIIIAAIVSYSRLFGSKTTKLICVRATKMCELSGGSRKTVAIEDISGAELESYYQHREGEFKAVTLLMKNGTKNRISPQGAREEGAVSEYRAAVESIRSFLNDRSKPRLETSWTYVASAWEKVRGLLFFGGSLLVMGVLLVLWQTNTTTFDQSTHKMVSRTSGPFRGRFEEIAFDQITAVNQQGAKVELVLSGGATRTIVDDAGFAPSVAREVKELVGK